MGMKGKPGASCDPGGRRNRFPRRRLQRKIRSSAGIRRDEHAGRGCNPARMPGNESAIRAAVGIASAHGIVADRCEVLQDGNTLVLRLTETLVARVVQDREGPRQGTAWFARENAVALHLARHGAPVIPLHPRIPPGPHFHLGYPVNFWSYAARVPAAPAAEEIGRTLARCHQVLAGFPEPLPHLAILWESARLLDTLERRGSFAPDDLALLRHHLRRALDDLAGQPAQPLHGDAHEGNLMNTADGLLWTDWEDTFLGPVEWDLASITWNTRILENDAAATETILAGYRAAGGSFEPALLDRCLDARAAVMSAWYPVLYPDPAPERREKLRLRLDWLRQRA
jgi:hypothetical protein